MAPDPARTARLRCMYPAEQEALHCLPPLSAPATAKVCEDCGALILDADAHQRFHAILDHHARALAVLENSHIAQHVHDRFDVRERIGRPADSWSADALAEVSPVGTPPADDRHVPILQAGSRMCVCGERADDTTAHLPEALG